MATKVQDNDLCHEGIDNFVYAPEMSILAEPQPIKHTEHEADRDIAAGRVKRFATGEAMLKSLTKGRK